MKKFSYIILIQLFTLSGNQAFSSSKLMPIILKVDSLVTYYWNEETQEWDNPSTSQNSEFSDYTYINGLLTQIEVRNRLTQKYISRFEFDYDSRGNRTNELYKKWDGTNWVNFRLKTWKYNEKDQIIEYIKQFWNNNQWENNGRWSNYVYDSKLRLLSFVDQIWKNNQWIDQFAEEWSYDDSDRLSERQSILNDGTPGFRYIYSYEPLFGINEYVYQTWSETGWINGVRRITRTDKCGNTISQVRMHWSGVDWVKYSKKYYFTSLNYDAYPYGSMIYMCNKGITKTVFIRHIQRNLARGYCLGECIISKHDISYRKYRYNWAHNKNNHKKSSNNEDDFKSSLLLNSNPIEDDLNSSLHLYPNPISDRATLTIPQDIGLYYNLFILDLTGKVIRQELHLSTPVYTFYRNNQNSGFYILRISGEKTYQIKFIVE